jgi:hypothetical protein
MKNFFIRAFEMQRDRAQPPLPGASVAFTSYFIMELLHGPAQSPFSLRALPSMSLITIRSIHPSSLPRSGLPLASSIG